MDADNLHRRLKKIIGQVQAIDRMVDQDVPCEDVLAQINAAKSALHGCGKVVLEGHIRHATKDAPLETIGGLTPDQRFFLAYAGVWAANITEEEIRNRTKMDPHSLGEWRVNGALPHINAWYEAYGVKPGDKLYLPEDKRLKLW